MLRTSYGIICIAISLFCLYMMQLCRKKQVQMSKVSQLVCLSGALLVFFNSLTLFFQTPVACHIALSGMLVCADFFLYFVFRYTVLLTETKLPLNKISTLMAIFIFIDSAVILSDPWTKIVLQYNQRPLMGETFYVIHPNFWYYIHCSYIYLTVIVVIVILVRKCIKVPFVYAGRYLLELSVVLSVVAVNLLYLLVWIPVDLSCGLYAWVSYVVYRSAINYKPRLLRKEARYLITNEIEEPILLFDIMDRLADFNDEAAEKFNITENDLCNLTRRQFEDDCLHMSYEENPVEGLNREFYLQKDYADIAYQITVQTLFSKHDMSMGKIYNFHDITKQKMMYNALENMAAYEPLTGFYSSRTFATKLAEWNKEPKEYVIAICNLAGMKLINSFYDRTVGNGIIQRMSELIRDILPENVLVCYAEDDSTIIIAKEMTESQMDLYLSNVSRKLMQSGLENVPVYLNYGIARRENTAVSIEEYIKYAVMDLLLKKGKDGELQKKEITMALSEEYFNKEYESKEHINRIKKMADVLAQKLQLNQENRKKLELLCMYHDIGRVKTREEVWSRAAVITRDELDIIKLHSIAGYQIISQMQLEYDIKDLVLYHHENFDGSGYPYGLAGEEIPLLARILAVVDAYDIMVNDQIYKDASSERKALEELRKNAGSQFDPEIVSVFEAYLKESKGELL